MKIKLIASIAIMILAAFVWQGLVWTDEFPGTLRPLSYAQRAGGARPLVLRTAPTAPTGDFKFDPVRLVVTMSALIPEVRGLRAGEEGRLNAARFNNVMKILFALIHDDATILRQRRPLTNAEMLAVVDQLQVFGRSGLDIGRARALTADLGERYAEAIRFLSDNCPPRSMPSARAQAPLERKVPELIARINAGAGNPDTPEIAMIRERITSLEKLREGIAQDRFPETAIAADDHGYGTVLTALVDAINAPVNPLRHVVFLGDAYDKGPRNRRNFEMLKELQKKLGSGFEYILGNHDILLIQAILLGEPLTPQAFQGPSRSAAMFYWLEGGGESVVKELWGLEGGRDELIGTTIGRKVQADPEGHSFEAFKLEIIQMALWLLKYGKFYSEDGRILVGTHALREADPHGIPLLPTAVLREWQEKLALLQQEYLVEDVGGVVPRLEAGDWKNHFGTLFEGRDMIHFSEDRTKRWIEKLKNGDAVNETKIDTYLVWSGSNFGVYGHDHDPADVPPEKWTNLGHALFSVHSMGVRAGYLVFTANRGVICRDLYGEPGSEEIERSSKADLLSSITARIERLQERLGEDPLPVALGNATARPNIAMAGI
ncbi:MAG: metallophosphoesterase family protein [Candidatus Omnitrophota bacterium]